MPKTTKVQAIFNKVLGSRYWPACTDFGYMCNSLDDAAKAGLITSDDKDYALGVIFDYVGPSRMSKHMARPLVNRLGHAGLPNKLRDMTAIYADWENRPELSYD